MSTGPASENSNNKGCDIIINDNDAKIYIHNENITTITNVTLLMMMARLQ